MNNNIATISNIIASNQKSGTAGSNKKIFSYNEGAADKNIVKNQEDSGYTANRNKETGDNQPKFDETLRERMKEGESGDTRNHERNEASRLDSDKDKEARKNQVNPDQSLNSEHIMSLEKALTAQSTKKNMLSESTLKVQKLQSMAETSKKILTNDTENAQNTNKASVNNTSYSNRDGLSPLNGYDVSRRITSTVVKPKAVPESIQKETEIVQKSVAQQPILAGQIPSDENQGKKAAAQNVPMNASGQTSEANERSNIQRTSPSLSEEAISNLLEKPSQKASENITINVGQKPQKTVEPEFLTKNSIKTEALTKDSANPEPLHQNTLKQQVTQEESEIHPQSDSSHAQIHKTNLSAEKMSTIKAAEKQTMVSETKELRNNIGPNEQVSTDTPAFSEVSAKAAVSQNTVQNIENTVTKLTVDQQIHETVVSSYRPGTQQILIRLDPPDLGRVTIQFVEENDGITGVLQVQKPETRHEIQQALPGIIQNLQDSNIQIKKLEVVLNNPNQQSATDENAANYNENFGQHNSPDKNSSGNTASFGEWGPNLNNPGHSIETLVELTDKSINMLI